MTITPAFEFRRKKMGKTRREPYVFDPNKDFHPLISTSTGEISTMDVLKCLRMLTFLPIEQIDEMDNRRAASSKPGQGKSWHLS